MAKHAHEHRKTICIATWWSPHERDLLVSRRKRSGYETNSAFLRASALDGPERQAPAFKTLRDARNEIMRFAGIVESLPPSDLRDETLAEAKAALGRICR